MKICKKCNRELKLNSFYTHKQYKDGYMSTCKDCYNSNRIKRDSYVFKEVTLLRKQGKRRCIHCNEIKNIENFNISNKGYYTSMCKPCGSLVTYKNKLKKDYNITYEDYVYMNSIQNGKCAICGNTSNKRLCVDHNHITNKVRELLCDNCNIGVGNFKEDIILLKNAVKYIKKHQK